MELDPANDKWPLDRSHFLAAIAEKAQLLRQGYAAGTAAATPTKPAGLCFAGMGFSGISANLIQDATASVLEIPITIVKHYTLPRHVDQTWQMLAVSYSGETEETLELARQAKSRGIPITSFATGGSITNLAKINATQPKGYQPRAALGYAWFSILGYLHASQILTEEIPVEHAAAAVEKINDECGPRIPEPKNPAKQLARAIADRVVQIYATPAFYGVGLEFCGMLNENAKKIADVDLVPESNHNDLTGWGDDPLRQHFAVVELSHRAEHPQILDRLNHMRTRYREWDVPWHTRQAAEIHSFADNIVEQARTIQFLDYVSFYAAMLRGQDPSEIREIMALKDFLRS